MPQSRTLFMGMAVHQETMTVAYIAQDHGAAGPCRGPRGPRQGDSEPRVHQRQAKATHLLFVYAARPGGSWLSRYLTTQGDACWGVAPALRPHKSGDRVHPNRRDALPLARLARSGALPLGSVPNVEDAATRALPRAREAPLSALQDATCRLNACLLRTGEPRCGPGPLGLRPPAVALRRRRSDRGAAQRLARRWPGESCAYRTPPAPRPGPARTGASGALAARGRGPPGPAGWAMHCGGHQGGRKRRLDALGAPKRPAARRGAESLGVLDGRPAPAGGADHSGEHPGAPGAARRRRG